MELGVYRQTLVWVKDSMVLGHSDYHYKHEPIFYGWKPGALHRQPPNRTQVSVWEIDRPKRNEEHPTMKPVELVAKAIENSSLRGESIYDPFLGSGTTLIAAEQLGRKCYGMEISPAYCDVIVKRWETLTGKKATRG
jgi:DNA modification methylase